MPTCERCGGRGEFGPIAILGEDLPTRCEWCEGTGRESWRTWWANRIADARYHLIELPAERWDAWRWPDGYGGRTIRRPFVCGYCNGRGGWVEDVPGCYGQGPHYTCGGCDGEGVVSLWEKAREAFYESRFGLWWVESVLIPWSEWRDPDLA